MERKIGSSYETDVQYSIGTADAFYSARFLLAEIERDPKRHYLAPSFIVTLCAGIEGAINDTFINFFWSKLGAEYKKVCKPFLFLNYRERLRLLFPIISGYKFLLNEEEPQVKALVELFELRSRLVHVKHHRRRATITEDEGGTRIEYHNADPTNYYSEEGRDSLPPERLRAFLAVGDFWSHLLSEIVWKIRHGRFNHRNVLIRMSPPE